MTALVLLIMLLLSAPAAAATADLSAFAYDQRPGENYRSARFS